MSENVVDTWSERLRRYHELLVDYGRWEDREYDDVDLEDDAAVAVVADRIRDEGNRRFAEIDAQWRSVPSWDRMRYRWWHWREGATADTAQ